MTAAPDIGLRLRLLDFKLVRKNSLTGFAAVAIDPPGLVINDIPVCQAANGRAWATLPSRPMIDAQGEVMRDDRGKVRYSAILEWRSRELRERFSNAVVTAVSRRYPDYLPGGNDP
jgi:hypothetical protein